MERYGNTWVYTEEEVLDEIWGPIGTPRRDAFERELEEDLRISLERQAVERAAKGLPFEYTEEELTCDDVEEEEELEVEMA